jgi:hypothetical protein
MMLSLIMAKTSGLTANAVGLLVPLAPKVPNPKPKPIPGMSGKADTILGALEWIGIIAGIAAVVVCAISLMFAFHRGEFGEKAKGLVGVSIGIMLVGAASAVVKFFV